MGGGEGGVMRAGRNCVKQWRDCIVGQARMFLAGTASTYIFVRCYIVKIGEGEKQLCDCSTMDFGG